MLFWWNKLHQYGLKEARVKVCGKWWGSCTENRSLTEKMPLLLQREQYLLPQLQLRFSTGSPGSAPGGQLGNRVNVSHCSGFSCPCWQQGGSPGTEWSVWQSLLQGDPINEWQGISVISQSVRPSQGGPGRGKLLGGGGGGDMFSSVIYSLASIFLLSEVTKVVTKRSQAAGTIFKMSAA